MAFRWVIVQYLLTANLYIRTYSACMLICTPYKEHYKQYVFWCVLGSSITKFRAILQDDWSVRGDKISQPLNHLTVILFLAILRDPGKGEYGLGNLNLLNF